jgi:hypothetical protein
MKTFYPILVLSLVLGGQNRIAAQNPLTSNTNNSNINNPAQRRIQQNQHGQLQRSQPGSQKSSQVQNDAATLNARQPQAVRQAQSQAAQKNPQRNPSQIHSGDATSRLPAGSAQPKRSVQPASNGQLAQSGPPPPGQAGQPQITPLNQQGSSAQPTQVEKHKRNNIYNIFVPPQPAPNPQADNVPLNTAPQPAAPQERQKNNPADIVNAVGNAFANILKANSPPAVSAPAITPTAAAATVQAVEKATLPAPVASDVDPKFMAGAFRQVATTQRQKAAEFLKNGQDAEGLAALEEAKKYEAAAKKVEEPPTQAAAAQAAPAAAEPTAEEKSAIQKFLESYTVKKALDSIAGSLNKRP